jgi:SAM-dependent methyltransferase
MKRELLSRLRCPSSGSVLRLEDVTVDGDEIVSGHLVTANGASYPIERCVPRFVPTSGYASNFGYQWNAFRRTQLDSASGVPVSRDRWYRYTQWTPEQLRDRWVLDVGCGAGRFAEVALEAGAHVVAVDYSAAVDACWTNLSGHLRLHVIQADIYHLPFAPAAFDFVYCLGVLQHTPDVHGAFRALPSQLVPGGLLAVDVYPRLWRNLLWSKYWLRPVTRRMPSEVLFRLVKRFTPGLLALSDFLSRIPLIGGRLRYAVPVVNYRGVYPLSEQQLLEWATLDTYDMLGPQYDQPQSLSTLRRWFEEARLESVCTERLGFNVGRGRAPRTAGANGSSERERQDVTG